MRGGHAEVWASAMAKERDTALVQPDWVNDWEIFLNYFNAFFKDRQMANKARHKLRMLKQGTMTADQYQAEFKLHMKDTGFNDVALVEYFKTGLNQPLVDQIYLLPDMPETLTGWMKWASRFDNQWREKQQYQKLQKGQTVQTTSTQSKPGKTGTASTVSSIPISSTTPIPSFTKPFSAPKQTFPVPMEVDSTGRYRAPTRSFHCYRCRQPGHIAKNCRSAVDINAMSWNELQAHVLASQGQEKTLPAVPTSTPSESSSSVSLSSTSSSKDFSQSP